MLVHQATIATICSPGKLEVTQIHLPDTIGSQQRPPAGTHGRTQGSGSSPRFSHPSLPCNPPGQSSLAAEVCATIHYFHLSCQHQATTLICPGTISHHLYPLPFSGQQWVSDAPQCPPTATSPYPGDPVPTSGSQGAADPRPILPAGLLQVLTLPTLVAFACSMSSLRDAPTFLPPPLATESP